MSNHFTRLLFILALITGAGSQVVAQYLPKFELARSGLRLERRTHAGTFYDVVGRKSALAGYENRAAEAWVYPLKILNDFKLSFRLEGYPLEIQGVDTMTHIDVRPESTVLTYTHAAFTVRQIIFAPLEEPGIIMLLEVQSALPLSITASFRPRLKLMWPAGLMTGNLGWDEDKRVYFITEETHRFVGVVGSPGSRDISVMPYQEEPRDVPIQFVMDVSPEKMKGHFLPIVIAGSIEGREKAREIYDRLLGSVARLYQNNVAHYQRLERESLDVETPDEQFNTAFGWAKVGIDKGVATNPFLGTGLVAGFRTSGESERPGFAWFFGRDALWTTFALNSCGDFATTRLALEFLKKFQREDGKIPHEISQSASLIPWFTEYEYPWASADATPLYVIAHADYWRASGDIEFLKANWKSILSAYRFTAATDTDKNGLVENTAYGHGWVEGGALYPPHEEIYMQGLWVEASQSMEELAEVMGDTNLAEEATSNAKRTSSVLEKTYWVEKGGFYAFATSQPRPGTERAQPGPNRERRQARMNELGEGRLIDENTVMPAIPLWWGLLEDERAQTEIDHLGSGAIATDWGARIISNQSRLYDPLSYHNGSVWPLFTGWVAVGAYRYGRSHVGYQALLANVSLSYTGALGYVTELLSGDFNTPFSRSSHHQVWSQAMVITPAVRGLFGISAEDAGNTVRFAPQFPAHWNDAAVRNVRIGGTRLNLEWRRAQGRQTFSITGRDIEKLPSGARRPLKQMVMAPAFPLDARIRRITINGRDSKFTVEELGDRLFVETSLTIGPAPVEVAFFYDEGTDVHVEAESPRPGASSHGLRILRANADSEALHLTLEGVGGASYALRVYSPHRLVKSDGVEIKPGTSRGVQHLSLVFDGEPGLYVRRELTIPLRSGK